MKKISFVSKILDLLFPPKCVCCGSVTGSVDVLCDACLQKYSAERKAECPICGNTAQNCVCYLPEGINGLICSTFYTHYRADSERVSEKLIYVLKRRKNSRVFDFFGREAAVGVMRYLKTHGLTADECVITYPPRSERSMEKYGFDHAERVAERISEYTGIKLIRALKRTGGDEQKTLEVSERFSNAMNTLSISHDPEVAGKCVFVFDDVITTGATLKVSARLLRLAGATDIIPVTIARTENLRR